MMITVCDERRLRLRALESGATDFLRAPVDHYEFLTRARNLLKLSRSVPPRGANPCCAAAPAETNMRQRAAQCLREAIASARDVRSVPPSAAAEPSMRFAPVVELAAGELAGAQLLRGDSAGEAADFEALRAALVCAAKMGLPASDSFCISLRLTGEGMETSFLRLLPLLAETAVSSSRLDVVLGAKEIAADDGRVRPFVRNLQALGVGITLDIGELPASELQDASFLTTSLGMIAESPRPGISFSCLNAGGLETGSFLRAWVARRLSRATVLLASGVPSPALLPLLRRAGVGLAQGPCFGAPIAPRNLPTLLAAHADGAVKEIEARRA